MNATTWGGTWQITRISVLGSPCIMLRIFHPIGEIQKIVTLSYWKPRFGGESVYLLCPTCGRKCRKIYAPSGADYRCRICWKLAYISSQEAHKWDRGRTASLLAPLFAAEGISMREVEKTMRAEFKAMREEDRRRGE